MGLLSLGFLDPVAAMAAEISILERRRELKIDLTKPVRMIGGGHFSGLRFVALAHCLYGDFKGRTYRWELDGKYNGNDEWVSDLENYTPTPECDCSHSGETTVAVLPDCRVQKLEAEIVDLKRLVAAHQHSINCLMGHD